jgi:TolB protein
MTSKKILVLMSGLVVLAPAWALFSRQDKQDVIMTIREGQPSISIALPKFSAATPSAQAAAEEIFAILTADLKYSRVFQLLPESYYSYIRPLDPANIIFKDWESLNANILFIGDVSSSENGDLVLQWKLYDVKPGQPIQAKKVQAKPADLRYMTHKTADDLLRIYGEKPVFTTKIAFVSDRDGNWEIYMMDYDGANQTRLTFNKVDDYGPAWSPNQKRIAYTSYQNLTGGLYILDVYEGKRTPVSTKGLNYAPAWSPDGKQLAFSSSMDGNQEIYVAEILDGPTRIGKVKRLTYNTAVDQSPSWSPTGRQVAFVSDRSGAPRIYTMDAEGSNIVLVSFGGSNHNDEPAWSPIGDRIVYVARVDNIFDLYILNLRTQQISRLTGSNARNETPSWSPDGRHVIFTSNIKGGLQLYSIDVDGANLRQLTTTGQNRLADWGN